MIRRYSSSVNARTVGAHVPLSTRGQGELRRNLVVRRLRKDDGVEPALHEMERLELASERLQRLLRLFQAAGALLDVLDALLRVLEKGHVRRHMAPPASGAGPSIRALRIRGHHTQLSVPVHPQQSELRMVSPNPSKR